MNAPFAAARSAGVAGAVPPARAGAARRSVFDASERDETAATIEAVQLPDGMIPWYRGGHGDPWNHVEAAMALSATGRRGAAERAYSWLLASQRSDGAWHTYYMSDGSVEEARLDTNVVAYIATGVWHHYLATGDTGFLEQMWPAVDAAISWVVAHQRPAGELVWAVDPDGTPGAFALLAASSSACTSLSAALACASVLGRERPRWEVASRRLTASVARRPWAFAAKHEFAMDWYYPVLCGAIAGASAEARLDKAWSIWVVEGHGVRCRSDGGWVTTAETAECAMAYARLGRFDVAGELIGWTRSHRTTGGEYVTGLVHPGGAEFPAGERTTYSAAAVLLAADLLAGGPATSSLFAGVRCTTPGVAAPAGSPGQQPAPR